MRRKFLYNISTVSLSLSVICSYAKISHCAVLGGHSDELLLVQNESVENANQQNLENAQDKQNENENKDLQPNKYIETLINPSISTGIDFNQNDNFIFYNDEVSVNTDSNYSLKSKRSDNAIENSQREGENKNNEKKNENENEKNKIENKKENENNKENENKKSNENVNGNGNENEKNKKENKSEDEHIKNENEQSNNNNNNNDNNDNNDNNESTELELPVLTETDFEDTVQTGRIWIIKHFSPYCTHCKALAPIWKELYNKYNNKLAKFGIHFADIDCVASGDLCNDHEVVAYPDIAVYKDGYRWDKFPNKYPKTEKRLTQFFKKILLSLLSPDDNTIPSEIDDARSDLIDFESLLEEEVPINQIQKASTVIPNQHGIVQLLSHDNFTKEVINSNNIWFIAFYQKNSKHYRSLIPAWNELAKQMTKKINIGAVDCSVDSAICDNVKISSSLSLVLFKRSDRVEYMGLYGLGDLLDYAKKASDSNIEDVDIITFDEYTKRHEALFLYFYDENAAPEDFQALERLTLPLVGHGKILITKDDALANKYKILSFPSLVAINDGRPQYFPSHSPKDIRNRAGLLTWMSKYWLPLLSEISVINARDIMSNRIVVLAILNKNRKEEVEMAKKELRSAAIEFLDYRSLQEKSERAEQRRRKQLKIEEAEDKEDKRAINDAKGIRIDVRERRLVAFTWIDGIFWERWIKTTFGVSLRNDPSPKVIIFDQARNMYWDTTIEGGSIGISRTGILETIIAITQDTPLIPPKQIQSRLSHFILILNNHLNVHILILSWIALALVAFALILFKRYLTARYHGKTPVRSSPISEGNTEKFD